MKDRLAQKQENRFKFLNRLYEITDGHRMATENAFKLGQELGFSEEEADNIVGYLDGEGLIECRTIDGEISISHRGVLEIEQAHRRPEKETEHFPPRVSIINIGTVKNSQIQQGTINSHQHQTISSSADIEAIILELLACLKKSQLSEDQVAIAESNADIVLSQAKLPPEKRDTGLVEKAWGRLDKVMKLASAATMAYKAAKAISGHFGIELPHI